MGLIVNNQQSNLAAAVAEVRRKVVDIPLSVVVAVVVAVMPMVVNSQLNIVVVAAVEIEMAVGRLLIVEVVLAKIVLAAVASRIVVDRPNLAVVVERKRMVEVGQEAVEEMSVADTTAVLKVEVHTMLAIGLGYIVLQAAEGYEVCFHIVYWVVDAWCL